MEQLVTSNFKLGIIAGGQLGKMLALTACNWDVKHRFYTLCTKINDSIKNKKGQQSFYELLPCRVENTGFEPVTSCLPGKRSSQMS